MSVTADSTVYTADVTCITADGFNGCVKKKTGGRPASRHGYAAYNEEMRRLMLLRIKREDLEIIEFFKTLLTKGLM